MNRYGLRVGDLFDWQEFTKKYNYMYKIYQEKEKLSYNTEEELEIFRQLREKLINNPMIKDTVVMLVNYSHFSSHFPRAREVPRCWFGMLITFALVYLLLFNCISIPVPPVTQADLNLSLSPLLSY